MSIDYDSLSWGEGAEAHERKIRFMQGQHFILSAGLKCTVAYDKWEHPRPWPASPGPLDPRCGRCLKRPHDCTGYVMAAREYELSPAAYVRQEEGTYDAESGFFTCDECYVKLGTPTAPGAGWKATPTNLKAVLGWT